MDKPNTSSSDSLSTNRKRLLLRRLQSMTKVADTATNSGSRLIAFVLSHGNKNVNEAQLRSHCDDALPNYMVPQLFVFLDQMPRTAAGKIDRRKLALHEIISSGQDDGLVAPRNEIERVLADIWSQVLGMDDISVLDNFFEVGGDSLQIIRILSRAAKEGLTLKPDVMFAHPTIAEQANYVSKMNDTTSVDISTGVLPVTPIQHWFFSRIKTDLHHWNQSILFEVDGSCSREQIEQVYSQLVDHHDVLRCVFGRANHQWTAEVLAQIDRVDVRFDDCSSLTPDEFDKVIDQHSDAINASLRLEIGPLIVFGYFKSPEALPDRLLIAVHHLVIDAESWQLINSDIETLIMQALNQQPLKLSEKSSSFVSWASQLSDYAKSSKGQDLAVFWANQCRDISTPIPVDIALSENDEEWPNKERHTAIFTSGLDVNTTQVLLDTTATALGTKFNVLLTSALAQVLAHWNNSSTVVFDMEGHGREALFDQLSIARTVGWFTSVFPVVLRADSADAWSDPHLALRCVKQALQSMPLKGMGYGLAKELGNDTPEQRDLKSRPNSQVLFNYLGNITVGNDRGSIVRVIDERRGTARSPNCNRAYLLEVNTRIENQALVVDWSYNPKIHHEATVKRLAQQFSASLNAYLEIAQAGEATPIIVPADFPLAALEQSEFDNLASQLGDLDDD